jgi:hypothetical protein
MGEYMRFGKSFMIAVGSVAALAAAEPAAAAFLSPLAAGAAVKSREALQPAHGFHCRPEYGWNPRTGYYDLHIHQKSCRDYRRCVGVYRKCLRLFGNEYTQRRYTLCMMELDCY